MAPMRAGGSPRPRRTGEVVAVLSLVCLAAAVPSRSRAADLNLSSGTYLLSYESDVAGGKQSYLPLYEYLSADAHDLGGRPLSFHFYGWGRIDLDDDTDDDGKGGFLSSAYLQYRHPQGNAEVRLGRFFLAEGSAAETLDGAFVKFRTGSGIGLSAFGGVPVERSITATETGDSIYGGRLFFARAGFAEIGATYLFEDGDFRGDDREIVGADLWLRPGIPVEITGRADYNLATEELAYQRYALRIQAVKALDLSVGYEDYTYADLFQNSLNPVFLPPTADNTDQVRSWFALLDFHVAGGLSLQAGYKDIRHDRDDPGDAQRATGGLRFVFHGGKDVAGLSAAIQSADREENEYEEYRGFLTFSPGNFRFTADALTQKYKKAISGIDDAWQLVGSAAWQALSWLRVAGDLTYTESPRFDKDYAGLVKIVMDLGHSTGGAK